MIVLEMANNHWGDAVRGEAIARAHGRVCRSHSVRASVKLQVRSQGFVHKNWLNHDSRYIKKVVATWRPPEFYVGLADAIRACNCSVSATPFDERAVETCLRMGCEFLKVASSDVQDWLLLEEVCKAGLPVVASTGGTSEKDVDDLVEYCDKRSVPLVLCHCVSLYPTPDEHANLDQVDWLRARYPHLRIGLSTHCTTGSTDLFLAAAAKGVDWWEWHVDLPYEDKEMSAYCCGPDVTGDRIATIKRAQLLCGGGKGKRLPGPEEVAYLDELVRGLYFRRPVKSGDLLRVEDVYAAVPLQAGQVSVRDVMLPELLMADGAADGPIMAEHLDICDHVEARLRRRGAK